MFGILPLIFALVIAQTAEHLPPPPTVSGMAPWLESVLVIIACVVAWAVSVLVAARFLRSNRSPRLLAMWDAMTTGATLGIFALWCYELGWGQIAGFSSLVQLAPFIGMLIPAWYAGGLAWSAAGDRRPAVELLAMRLKFGLLPALVALGLFDLARWLVVEPLFKLEQADAGAHPMLSLLLMAASFGTVFAVLLIMPMAVVRLWGARQMPASPERELIEDGCRRAGIAVSRIMTWPPAAGRLYNAAVMGMIPRFRYVLFSTDLLRDLPNDQLTAVLGHELGHIKHRHLWIYLLFLVVSVMWSWGLSVPAAELLAVVPGFDHIGFEARQGFAVVMLFLLFLRFLFGVLSRACERQADLAGAKLAGSTEAMRQALLSVSVLSGQPVDAPSWRHHSIRERMAYLATVQEDPEAEPRHHGEVRRLLLMVCLLLVVGIGTIAMLPMGLGSADAWLDDHPETAELLDHATDTGAWKDLSIHMAEVDDEQAQMIRMIITQRMQERFVNYQTELNAGRATTSEAQELYAIRGLLYPLVAQPSDNPDFDVYMANNAAYAAVAGTSEPSAEDLEIARSALPMLNRAAHHEASSAYHDTVGAILFRLGKRDEARNHFSIASQLAPRDMPKDRLGGFLDLLQRRIIASGKPEATLPLELAPSGQSDED
ncbi:MAG: M48 family metallopeptidase [Planctomycetota bacterium]|jgi:Zn-dependent protease with chaperone function|nr:M48 family metallopeptidase [Planctomycetota bacterium]